MLKVLDETKEELYDKDITDYFFPNNDGLFSLPIR